MQYANSRYANAEMIAATLKRMVKSANGTIMSAAAMTTDGFIIGSALRDETNQDTFAAMNASLLVLAQRTSEEVAIGELKQVMVQGSEGVMHLTHIGSDAVLAVATDPSANMGRILLETRSISVRIQEYLNAGQNDPKTEEVRPNNSGPAASGQN